MANTQLRISDDNFEKIKIIAKRQNRSMNGQFNFIIEQFIQDYEKVNGKIDIKKDQE